MVTKDLWAPWLCLEAAKDHIPFSVVLVPDLRQGCGVEWAGARGRMLWLRKFMWLCPPARIYAASVPVFSRTCLLQIQGEAVV